MSIVLPDLSATIRADINPLKVSFDESVKEANSTSESISGSFKKIDQSVHEADGGVKGFLETLKGSLGHKSVLNEFAELAVGGGVILGLNAVTDDIEKATEAAEKMVTAVRENNGEAGDLAIQFAESLPVLGNIIKAGQSIHEIITGDDLAIKEITDDAQRVDAEINAWKESLNQSHAIAESFSDLIARLDAEIGMLGQQPTPFVSELANHLGQVGEIFSKSLNGVNDNIKKNIGDAGIQTLDDLKKKVAELRAAAQQQIPKPIEEPGQFSGVGPDGALGSFGGTGVIKNKAEIDAANAAIENAKKQLQTLQPLLQQSMANVSAAEAGGIAGAAKSAEAFGAQWINQGRTAAQGFWKNFTTFVTASANASTAQINEAMKAIQHDIQIAGMSPEDQKLFDFKHIAGVTTEQIQQYTDAITKLKQASDFKQLEDSAKAFKESIETPAQKFNDTLTKLEQFKLNGLIDNSQFDKGVTDAMKERDKNAVPAEQTQFADLIKPGSSAALKLQFQGQRDTDHAQKIQELNQKQLDELGDIKDAIVSGLDFDIFSF